MRQPPNFARVAGFHAEYLYHNEAVVFSITPFTCDEEALSISHRKFSYLLLDPQLFIQS